MIIFQMFLVFLGSLFGGVVGAKSGNFVAGIVSGQIIANLIVFVLSFIYKQPEID